MMYAVIDEEGEILYKDSDKRACEIEMETMVDYHPLNRVEVIELEDDDAN